jgi:hypothetical protein
MTSWFFYKRITRIFSALSQGKVDPNLSSKEAARRIAHEELAAQSHECVPDGKGIVLEFPLPVVLAPDGEDSHTHFHALTREST